MSQTGGSREHLNGFLRRYGLLKQMDFVDIDRKSSSTYEQVKEIVSLKVIECSNTCCVFWSRMD